MAILGRACLIIALGLALYGAGASIYGARARKQAWIESGRRAVYAMFGVVAIAFVILIAAFIRSDFSFRVVVDHSSTTTPLFYRATAAWSSQEGSLLLWVFLLSLWSSLILFVLARKRKLREVVPYATAVLCGLGGFFLFCSIFLANPFGTLANPPLEGAGLNPLLRYPSMMIHPPALYSGYTLFTVPFAFGIGALVSGRLDASWITSTRRFALAAWFFLGLGILLGARWSYSELGWGGYWAWDPVENASLMPWLVGTAFLHSAMIQEKRGMLKVWNVSLVLAAGVLAVLGTFLVRSGILDSIHAFGASTLGVPFIVLIAVMALGSIGLVIWRRASLRSEHRLDSLFSREAIFLLNNLVLVGLCFVVFWGTFFPLISEAITGDKAAVGPPWFDRYTVPLALILVLLSGIGPVIAWRRATVSKLARYLAIPLAVGIAVPLLCLAFGVRPPRRGPADVRHRRLLADGGGPGVRARRRRTPGHDRRRAPGRAARARAPQPPSLWRLRGARRDGGAVHRRGRVVDLPQPARRAALARPDDQGRRLRRPLRQADLLRGRRPSQHRRDHQPRRRARRLQERQARDHAEPEPRLLPRSSARAR